MLPPLPRCSSWVYSSLIPPRRVSLARRSLALRPAHSRGHQFVTAIRRLQPFRYLHDCSDCFRRERIAGWDLHPLESAALPRRTPKADLRIGSPVNSSLPNPVLQLPGSGQGGSTKQLSVRARGVRPWISGVGSEVLASDSTRRSFARVKSTPTSYRR